MLGNIKHLNTLEDWEQGRYLGSSVLCLESQTFKTIMIPPTVANVCGMFLFIRIAIMVSSTDHYNPGIYV